MRLLLTMRYMLAVAALWAATAAWSQWSFTLDPTFQVQITQQNVNSLLLNEDGTLITSGVMRFPGEMSDKRLVRLLPTGVRDPAFNNSGLGGSKLIRWQERFYVGASGFPRRILSTGYQDPTFGSPNLNPCRYFNSLQGGDYHVFPDGRVLITGNHQLNDSLRGFVGRHQLIWLTNEGCLDTTRTHRSGGNCAVYRFAELPNGQFICSGLCDQFDGQEIDRIFRLNADGSVDTTFRTGVYTGSAFDYLPLDDGQVYVAGNFRRTQAMNDTLRLVRFLPNGELDPTFTIPQFTLGEGLSSSVGAVVHRITPWRQGTLIITGQFKRVNGQLRKGICLIDPTGQLLNGFDGQGVGPFTFSSTTNAALLGPVFNSDSTQMYVCGAYSGYNDGLTDYPEQRFITRLNVQELSVGAPAEPAQPSATFGVYPNPSRDQVVLRYDFGDTATQLRAELRDAVGRIVASIPLDGARGQMVFDVAHLMPGTYLIQYFSSAGLAGSVPLMVQQ